ncbi:unnamed protein product [Paramecium sonneborni]|uniref:non-specific serine/threonine protein kinase n=1 Tax=Paramecium sonneborni TaxID=65129 RepID=A0A8S1PBU5_9CILI|nr:unnamed protein product [Paramecium sonneborni]
MKGIQLQNQHKKENKMNIKSFYINGLIGEGAYSEVYEAIYLKNNRKVAIKKIYKESITLQNKQCEIYIERHMMKQYSQKHPSLVEFIGSFQDKQFLYFVFEHCPFGDLGNIIQDVYQFYINTRSQELEYFIKVYIYQITQALIYLHNEGIAHLDIKPKNILIDKNCNLKLTDFATCLFFQENKQPQELIEQIRKYQPTRNSSLQKIESESTQNRSNFVGTPEYISPEMLNNSRASKEADLWALGCIVYEFYHGQQPFTDISENEIFNNIVNLNFKIDDSIPNDAQDLIRSLLVLNPSERLGQDDSKLIIQHQYFQDIKQDYIPWQIDIDIPLEYKGLFQEIIPSQSKSSILWEFASGNIQMNQEIMKKKQDSLKTITEELNEAITPISNGLIKPQKICCSQYQPIFKPEHPIIQSSSNQDEESNFNLVFKHFDKCIGFIYLNTNRWFCIPQIAILVGYLKPPCLLIDFIKGEKKYLLIDDTIKISSDGVHYVPSLEIIRFQNLLRFFINLRMQKLNQQIGSRLFNQQKMSTLINDFYIYYCFFYYYQFNNISIQDNLIEKAQTRSQKYKNEKEKPESILNL